MDLNSDAWRDLIFEGKNRKYGAYYLRRTSSRRHLVALAITLAITVASILLMWYIVIAQKANESMLKTINLSDLTNMESLYFEDPAQLRMEEPVSEEKGESTPPEIVQEEELAGDYENEIQTEMRAVTSAITVETDSVGHLISLKKNLQTEASEDTVTYMLDEKDPSQEFQLLRTTILRYVYQNLKYPEIAYKQRIRGRVICSFTVNETGTVSDISLVTGVYVFLDEEVLRVLHSMPACKPVIKDNEPVKVKCYLPIVFSM